MENIFWAGYCNAERNTAINQIKRLTSEYGDIIDFKLFSDISLTFVIEIQEFKLNEFNDALREYVVMDNYKYLASISHKERTLFLNITFSKGSGNLKIEIPSVPG